MGRLSLGLALGCVSCTFGGAGAGAGAGDTSAGSSDGAASSEGGATTSPSGGQSGHSGSEGAADDVSDSIDGDETTGGDDDGATTTSAADTTTDTTVGDGDDAPPGDRCGDGVRTDDEACDDANDDELDGCTSACERGPQGIVLGEVDETDEFGGSATGSLDADIDCGANQVLTGLRVEFSTYIAYYVLGTVAAICAPIALTNATPTAVGFGPTVALPESGTVSGDSFDLACPPNAAVSGLFGTAGQYTDTLGITCRSLAVNKAQDTVVLGPLTTDGPAGDDGGQAESVDCTEGWIAAGYRIRGDDRATGFNLRCRRPNILTE